MTLIGDCLAGTLNGTFIHQNVARGIFLTSQ